jgi:hypothetical protein
MFWKRKDDQGPKLPGPKDIPDMVKKSPEFAQKIESGTIPFLKILVKNKEKEDKAFDFRIYDPADAEARLITIKNYTTLDEQQDMIIADGWYNDASKKVELTVKRPVPPVKLLTYNEILAQIEGLKEPGSSVFFYMAAGPSGGGPLGRGSTIVRLNAPDGEKKQKKYSIYSANVINMQPSQSESKVFDADKTKDIAKWIAEGHKPRFC